MPIPVPGDEAPAFADLMAQARTLIPALDPGWTDLNPSDPGVALAELFAWLTEMMMFQAGQVPEKNVRVFLALLEGPHGASAALPLDSAKTQVARGQRERYRAATEDDVRYLLLTTWPGTADAIALGGAGRVARVLCLPNRDLTAAEPTAEAPAHLSVVVVPAGPRGGGPPQPSGALLDALSKFLLPRRLLTTRHHVVGPGYLPVRVQADVALRSDAVPDTTFPAAKNALAALLDPLTGGADGAGWPFGRAVFGSELYATLEGVTGIDYVENLTVTAPDPGPADLVRLTTVTFTGYGSTGRTYPYTWAAS
ncbi:hypothetical protein AB0M46_04115 [Dactylosporangium sp. NPDC051485]|uniref:hypothetical protein n=1 Tax=Dactylosporangium sp. NPDC051485 TaxID=3154846 RepID=UPI00342E3509